MIHHGLAVMTSTTDCTYVGLLDVRTADAMLCHCCRNAYICFLHDASDKLMLSTIHMSFPFSNSRADSI